MNKFKHGFDFQEFRKDLVKSTLQLQYVFESNPNKVRNVLETFDERELDTLYGIFHLYHCKAINISKGLYLSLKDVDLVKEFLLDWRSWHSYNYKEKVNFLCQFAKFYAMLLKPIFPGPK